MRQCVPFGGGSRGINEVVEVAARLLLGQTACFSIAPTTLASSRTIYKR